MKNIDEKIARLRNRDGSLYTEDNSLIAKYKVGKQIQFNRDGESKDYILKLV